MRHPFVLPFLTAALIMPLVFISAAASAELADRIVAVVNDDIITHSDIETEGKDIFKQVQKQVPAEEMASTLNQIRRDILSSLIDKKLVEQRAAKLEMKVTPDEVDRALEHNLARNGITLDEFTANLSKRGSNIERYRDNLKWEILKMKLISYEIQSKVVISEEKIKEYYATNYMRSAGGSDGYHLQQMGFLIPDGGDARKIRAKAMEVRQLAVDGQNFPDLARTNSDLPSAASGGDIGIVSKNDLAAELGETLGKLKPGEVSDLLELPAGKGFQFFKMVSLKDSKSIDQTSLDAVRSQITEALQEKEMRLYFEKWVKKLRDDAYIKEIN